MQVGLDGDGGGKAWCHILTIVYGHRHGVRRVHHYARAGAVQDPGVQRVDGIRA